MVACILKKKERDWGASTYEDKFKKQRQSTLCRLFVAFHILYVEKKVVLIKVSISLHIDILNQMSFINHIFF